MDEGKAQRKTIQLAVELGEWSVARQAMKQLGLRRVAGIGGMEKRLKARDASLRFAAAAAMGRIGDLKSVAALMEALDEEDLFVRNAVFTALNRIGRANPAAWTRIVEGLSHRSDRVREGTRFAMRQTYEPALIAALVEVIENAPLARTRESAVTALADLHRQRPEWKGEWWAYHPVNSPPPEKSEEWEGTKAVLSAIARALEDENLRVREAAVAAVAESRHIEAAPKLREMFAVKENKTIGARIVESLGVLKDKEARSIIVRAMSGGEDSQLILASIAVAERIGGEELAEPLIRLIENTEDFEVRRAAVRTVGELKASAAVNPLARLAAGKNAELRGAAAGAIARIGDPGAASALIELMENKEIEVRRAAVAAIGAERLRAMVPELIARMGDRELREDVIAALSRMPDGRAAAAYLEGLGSRNAALRDLARKAMAAVRDEALAAVEAAARELPPQVIAQLRELYKDHDKAKAGVIWKVEGKVSAVEEYERFAEKASGDADRGRAIFDDVSGVNCIGCHVVCGKGGTVGPDLTTAGTQFSRAQLIESILYPSKAVREGYQEYVVDLKNREQMSGLLKSETVEEVAIVDAEGTLHRIRQGDIRRKRPTNLSLMPEGLASGLTLEEFADLVAYVESLKGKQICGE
jgi:putative heme-binding domain-containing protein